MATVWLRLRADVRARWRALAGLALLLGIIGGVVLTAAAGARRTDTAYPRLLQSASAAQVDILPESNRPTPGYDAALARLPQVAAMSTAVLYQAGLPVRHGPPVTQVLTFSSPDRTWGVSVDRVKIVQGQLFNPGAAGQAMVDPQLASLEHLQPGGTLHLLGIPSNPKTGGAEPNQAVPLSFRVSAIVVFDPQVVPTNLSFSGPMALLSSPFSATRDLAVLKTLGLVRSQVLRVVAWEASALAGAALLAGLPLGVLAGRWAWAVFAGSAGVSGTPDVPVALVLAAIPVTLVLANLIAAGPGWDAARLRPASVLRTE
jgi:FtsX-like permease family